MMSDATREKLLALRAEIVSESASLAARLAGARQSIADAEAAFAAARAVALDVREVIAGAAGGEPVANRLMRFLRDTEVDNSIASAPGVARRELAQIENEISDCGDALTQIDRALNGTWPVALLGREPPTVIRRPPAEPVEVDLIEMPAGAAA